MIKIYTFIKRNVKRIVNADRENTDRSNDIAVNAGSIYVIYVYAWDRYRHFRDEFYSEIGDLTQQAGQVRIGDLDSVQCICR